MKLKLKNERIKQKLLIEVYSTGGLSKVDRTFRDSVNIVIDLEKDVSATNLYTDNYELNVRVYGDHPYLNENQIEKTIMFGDAEELEKLFPDLVKGNVDNKKLADLTDKFSRKNDTEEIINFMVYYTIYREHLAYVNDIFYSTSNTSNASFIAG